MYEHLKHELHNVISGKSPVRFGATIQAIAGHLGDGTKASSEAADPKQVRKEETEKLESFIKDKELWVRDIDFSQYVSEGAEQKVFLTDPQRVLKLNDAIYYQTWKDYFQNLLLHNFFFTDTAYDLLGFARDEGTLYAVVQQSYVAITEATDLAKVKAFLEANGFVNTRNHDYHNPELGIILEDLHDENVLTRNGMLYFIDTVFYTTPEFWNAGPQR